MLKIAILDDYQRIARDLADWSSPGPDCEVESSDRNIASPEDAAATLSGFDVLCLMRERMPLTAAHFALLPRLRLVVVTGARVRCIDHDAARAHGVTVCVTGEAGNNGPAELTMALILSAARLVVHEDRAMRAGGWQQGLGMLLEGRTLGVVGLGRIGQRVAELGTAFGMRAIAWSPNLTPERALAGGAEFVPRDRFFAEADVISVHMVLTGATRHLVGRAEIGRMQPHALLVNTSRGGLIDEAALIEALTERRIGGAALDVYETEPLPVDHPLRSLPNTVLTPHVGYVTDATYQTHYTRTVAVIAAWRAGRPIGVQT